jgi:hypothetical protein
MVNYCFAVPFLPGGIELLKKWNDENLVDKEGRDRFFKAAGISREQVWIQRNPDRDLDLAIISFETHDPFDTLQQFATSTDPWAVKFREFTKKAYGIDFAQESQLNEIAIDWRHP